MCMNFWYVQIVLLSNNSWRQNLCVSPEKVGRLWWPGGKAVMTKQKYFWRKSNPKVMWWIILFSFLENVSIDLHMCCGVCLRDWLGKQRENRMLTNLFPKKKRPAAAHRSVAYNQKREKLRDGLDKKRKNKSSHTNTNIPTYVPAKYLCAHAHTYAHRKLSIYAFLWEAESENVLKWLK